MLIERIGATVVISLNRPEKRNALTLALLAEIGQAISAAGQEPNVRAVLVHGHGLAFSAGIDLGAFADFEREFGPNWRSHMLAITQQFQASLNLVAGCAVPTIALLHGFALGLGLELALACDLRLAAAGTQLGLPETRLGLIPDVGGTTRLTRLVGPGWAKQLILTGGTIDAETAHHWGLVTAVTSASELMDQGLALAAEITRGAPLAVNAAKRVINQVEADVARGLALEASAQNELVQTADFAAGVQAVLTRTPPVWQGR